MQSTLPAPYVSPIPELNTLLPPNTSAQSRFDECIHMPIDIRSHQQSDEPRPSERHTRTHAISSSCTLTSKKSPILAQSRALQFFLLALSRSWPVVVLEYNLIGIFDILFMNSCPTSLLRYQASVLWLSHASSNLSSPRSIALMLSSSCTDAFSRSNGHALPPTNST